MGWKSPAIWVICLTFVATAFAAAFTGWQAWTLGDTAYRQLRPYITLFSGPDAPKYNELSARNVRNYIIAETRFHNYGQTPAYNVRLDIEVKVLQHPLPSGFTFSTQHTDYQGLIAPHGDLFNETKSDTVLDEPDNAAIQQRRQSNLHLWPRELRRQLARPSLDRLLHVV
jgi:hypothetical protein